MSVLLYISTEVYVQYPLEKHLVCFCYSTLFSIFDPAILVDYAHHVADDGVVTNKMGEKNLYKDVIGGSPPFKHEGIAVYRDRFEGSHHNIFIADAHRYIYNIRWTIGSSRLKRCG